MELEQTVKFVRMTSGEDLISQITEVKSDDDSENYYILTNPMKLTYSIGGSNKPGMFAINLMQWVFNRICEDQDFTIYPVDILTIGNPTDDMIEYYWDCVDNFLEMKEKNKKNTEYVKPSDDEEEFEEFVDDSESLELLKNLLEGINKPFKGRLH